MSVLPRSDRAGLGLRAKLAIALVGLAVLAVDLSMLFSSLGLNASLESAAAVRLRERAIHVAHVAADLYGEQDEWTTAALSTLGHLAAADGMSVRIVDSAGRLLRAPGEQPPATAPLASAPVQVDGQMVARLTISPLSGQLLTPAERHLRHSVNMLHLYAGLASAVAALAVAFFLAWTLSTPLRRIRAAADRVSSGDLNVTVDVKGDQEIRAVGSALNRLTETLRREEELRKESVADLAHELRTPVTGLLSRIEAAQDGVLADPEANLAAMHTEAERLVRLLDDLRNLADAERPGLLLDKQPLDMAEVAGHRAQLVAPSFEHRDVRLVTDLRPAWVDGDAGRLDQIVANLLSNALRYTPPGGTVTLTAASSDGYARLEVSDTGMGIAAEDLDRIFTRFWRGEKSRSRETGGSGFGLTIVRELVRAHDGTIEVNSTPGEGSRFVVRLPARTPPQ
jgi:signal transduction histidine kinase